MHPSMTRILVTLLGLGLVVGVAGAVQAQEPTSTDSQLVFGIRPAPASEDDPTSLGYFTHYLEPGDELVDEALVINEGDLPVRLQIYVAEAMTAINGGTAFGHRNEISSGVTGWVSLDVGEVSLQPGETQIVPFTISVPADASPGDHIIGLVAEASPTANETGTGATAEEPQFAVQVVNRVGVAVVIDVAGDRIAELAITDLRMREQQDEGAVFEVAVHNQGNVMLRGEGSLVIADLEGTELGSIPLHMDTVLPGDTSFFYVNHPLRLADGEYLLGATIEYRPVRGSQESETAAIWGVELQVQDGQPKVSGEGGPSESPPEVTLLTSATEEGRSLVDQYGLYGVVLGLLALLGLLVIAWRRGSKGLRLEP